MEQYYPATLEEATALGWKQRSQWHKKEIIQAVREICGEEYAVLSAKQSLKVLQTVLLEFRGWFFNGRHEKINVFYIKKYINFQFFVDDLEDATEKLSVRAGRLVETHQRWLVEYPVYYEIPGHKRKRTIARAEGIVVGKKFFGDNGVNKFLSTKGFKKLKRIK